VQRNDGDREHSVEILSMAPTNNLTVVPMACLPKDTFTNLEARPKSNILDRGDIAVEKARPRSPCLMSAAAV